jgi:hypothetical protein
MLKPLIIILASFLCGQNSFGQFKSLMQIIPTDFTILDSTSGDINKDGVKDLVLILKNNYEKFNTDTTRPLLLLQGNKVGQYKLIARNDSVVLCMGCGGVHGDPYQDITIKNGYFSIEHFGGSSWRWTRIITFRFDTKTKSFYLHRDAGQSWHTSDPNKTTENLFNKTDFDKLSFGKYSYNKNW